MKLLVVGAGAVGRWFAGVVADDGELGEVDLAFADVEASAAGMAARTVGGRAVGLDGEGRADDWSDDEQFDAVVVAVPLPATAKAIATHADRAERAVLDLSGAMAAPVAAMAEHAPDRERVSLHPLFAPENAPGRVAVVAANPGPVTDGLRSSLAAAGNELFETTPEAHDRAMETVQAKAHAALLAFALAADAVDPSFGTPVYDRLVDLVAEVTGGEPRVYGDIQATFDGADAVAEAAREIAAADPGTVERLFRDAGDRLGARDHPDDRDAGA